MASAPYPGLRNLRVIFTLLVVLIAIGTVGFHFIEGWSWFDSFYTVLITVTTINSNDAQMNETGRVFSVFVIVVGVGLVFLAIGALASTLLEFELLRFFGTRRMEREISRLKKHYIICGAGRVGRSVARELQANEVDFAIVDNSQEKIRKLDSSWLVLNGDATQEAALRSVNIERAQGLVAAATTDAINVYIVLNARTLNPKLKIIARASEENAEKHLRTAGADIVLSPYTFVGHRIAQSFLRPHVIDFLDTATRSDRNIDWEIEEVQVTATSRFAGQTIAGSRIRQDMNVIVLAIKRANGMHFNPAPEDKIEAGDFLIAMGDPTSLHRLEESAEERVSDRPPLQHQRAVAAAVLVGPGQAGLHALEVRQAMRVVPARHARTCRPAGVIERVATLEDHPVDAARAAEHLPASVVDAPPVQIRLGLRLVLPVVEPAADRERQGGRHVDENVPPVVRPPGLQHQNPVSGGGQPVGQRAARGPAADDEEVVAFRHYAPYHRHSWSRDSNAASWRPTSSASPAAGRGTRGSRATRPPR